MEAETRSPYERTRFKRQKSIIIFFFLTVSGPLCAQVKLEAHVGFGYTEHFSVGVGVTLQKKHSISFIHGSNFFYDLHGFSNVFVQYQYAARGLSFARITPTAGLKGGQSVYTDHYYRWKVANVIPFLGLQCPVSPRVIVHAQGGVAFSFEQSVQRITHGEIGHYKPTLPEVKIGLTFNLTGNRQ